MMMMMIIIIIVIIIIILKVIITLSLELKVNTKMTKKPRFVIDDAVAENDLFKG